MRRTISAAVGLAVLCTVVPASAQNDLQQARAQREALQAEAAATASQIDVLQAEDAEIVAALDEVDGWIAVQEARLASAEQDLAATLVTEADARTRAGELALEIEQLNDLLTDQLVAGYIEGFSGDDSLILSTDDINSIPVLRFVLDESSGVSADTTDLLRVAQSNQEDAIATAEQAAADALGLRDDIEVRIGELGTTRATQQEIRAEVNRRISGLQEEADILAAADAEVERFIQAEVARLAAEEAARVEAARLEAERVEAARLEAERLEAERIEAERLEAERVEAAAAAELAAEEAPADSDDGDNEPEATETQADESEPAPTPEPDPEPSGAPAFIRPVPGAVSSGFGFRIHPVYGTQRLHTGLDFNASSGSPIGSAAGGTVIFAGSFSGYGNAVIVQHSGGYSTLYAHMSAFNVSSGATVNAGDTVGFVGSTGLSTGPHLHFEVRLNGSAIDPAPLL